MDREETKKCKTCDVTKPLGEFYLLRGKFRSTMCKPCHRQYNREHLICSDKQTYDRQAGDRRFFGGVRYVVLARDGYRCQKCGMTNDDHMLKYKREITIHHIDGNGRCSEWRNNDINNLITLCLKCHGRLDRLRYLSQRSCTNERMD